MKVSRNDKLGLISEATLTREGLRCTANLTRAGVFQYTTTTGQVIYEFRPEEEVFAADSIASYALIPVTDDHPPEPVTFENARLYQRGNVGDTVTRQDVNGDAVLVANVIINDSVLINKITSGKIEVSASYTLDLDPTPGEWNGQRYDRVQRNIRANHVAIVDKGRAGPNCALRLDSSDNQILEETMYTVKLPDGTEITGTLAEVMAKLQEMSGGNTTAEDAKRADSAITLLTKQGKELLAENKALKERADALDAQNKSIRARISLETRADGLKIPHKDINDRDLRVAIVKALYKVTTGIDTRSDDYLDALIDNPPKAVNAETVTRAEHDDASDDDKELTAALEKRAKRGFLQ